MKNTSTLALLIVLLLSFEAIAQSQSFLFPDRPEYRKLNHFLKLREWKSKLPLPSGDMVPKRITSGTSSGFVQFRGNIENGINVWNPVAHVEFVRGSDNEFQELKREDFLTRELLDREEVTYQNNRITLHSRYNTLTGSIRETSRSVYSYDAHGNMTELLQYQDTMVGLDTSVYARWTNLVLDNNNRVIESELTIKFPFWTHDGNGRVRAADITKEKTWKKYLGNSNLVTYDSTLMHFFQTGTDTTYYNTVTKTPTYLVENPRHPVPEVQIISTRINADSGFVPYIWENASWINQGENIYSEREEIRDPYSSELISVATSRKQLDFRFTDFAPGYSWLPYMFNPLVEHRWLQRIDTSIRFYHFKDSIQIWSSEMLFSRASYNYGYVAADSVANYELEKFIKYSRYTVDSKLLHHPKQSMIIGDGGQAGTFRVHGVQLPARQAMLTTLEGKHVASPAINTNTDVDVQRLKPGYYLLQLTDAKGFRHTGRVLLR